MLDKERGVVDQRNQFFSNTRMKLNLYRSRQSLSCGNVPYFALAADLSLSFSSSVIVAHLQTMIESRTRSVKYEIIQTIDISLLEPTLVDRNLSTLRANDNALWLPRITTVFLTGRARPRNPPAIQLSNRNMIFMIEEYPTIMRIFIDTMLLNFSSTCALLTSGHVERRNSVITV